MQYLKSVLILSCLSIGFTGCAYSDSALKVGEQQTKMVDAGYHTKIKMTEALTKFLATANKDCGVKVEVVNGTPITTVKECIRLADAMDSVNNVRIIQPVAVKDSVESAGDFILKASSLVTPLASIYYGFKNNEITQKSMVAMKQSDNIAQTNMWSSYTGKFQNNTATSNTATSNTSFTDKDYSNTVNTQIVPPISIDQNSTIIN